MLTGGRAAGRAQCAAQRGDRLPPGKLCACALLLHAGLRVRCAVRLPRRMAVSGPLAKVVLVAPGHIHLPALLPLPPMRRSTASSPTTWRACAPPLWHWRPLWQPRGRRQAPLALPPLLTAPCSWMPCRRPAWGWVPRRSPHALRCSACCARQWRSPPQPTLVGGCAALRCMPACLHGGTHNLHASAAGNGSYIGRLPLFLLALQPRSPCWTAVRMTRRRRGQRAAGPPARHPLPPRQPACGRAWRCRPSRWRLWRAWWRARRSASHRCTRGCPFRVLMNSEGSAAAACCIGLRVGATRDASRCFDLVHEPALMRACVQLEGELLSLKRLLTGGSPLLPPGTAASSLALTPASQLYFDADSGASGWAFASGLCTAGCSCSAC